MLRGKLDANHFRAIAHRFQFVLESTTRRAELAEREAEKETTLLESLMLRAEIFLQYSMPSKAAEQLERIRKLFPGEELTNDKLSDLCLRAGIVPTETLPPAGATTEAPGAAAATAPPAVTAAENAVDNITKVTEITRNICRQGDVKSVLFTGINEAGRHWMASRCIAVLCSPGNPPSIALEYCSPGLKQSDVHSIVKLIGILQPLAVAHGPLCVSQAGTPPALLPLKQFAASMGIDSMIAVPLVEGEQHLGLLLLTQCGAPREWQPTDIVVLRTIAEQMVLAMANSRLRSLVKNLAIAEEKSGLLKRSSYLDVLLSEVQRSQAQNSAVTLMLLHLGKVRELTKPAGEVGVESMMQQVGQLVCLHIRQNDLAIRYDLTTLALVLAGTDDKQAFFVLDKIRKVLANKHIPGSSAARIITAGIAGAVLEPNYDAVDIVTEVINRVETALDIALREGGNKAHSLPPALESYASQE